jgi:hypothetical protein
VLAPIPPGPAMPFHPRPRPPQSRHVLQPSECTRQRPRGSDFDRGRFRPAPTPRGRSTGISARSDGES